MVNTVVNRTIMSGAKETFLYFAYGSNLLTKRMHLQNPSAVFKEVARLGGYRLDFRIPSEVKPSKLFAKYAYYVTCVQRWRGCAATIIKSDQDHLYGCLWELNMEHLETLDNQEGVHNGRYERIKLEVCFHFCSCILKYQQCSLLPKDIWNNNK